MLNGKTVVITGGTGSFGRAFAAAIVSRYPQVKQLVVFSRDELKQYQMALAFAPVAAATGVEVRFVIGDVRDLPRLTEAFTGADVVLHAAAMKHVPIAEANPTECIKTNIVGSMNVIAAAQAAGVRHVLALSTAKAAAPHNLYGATKLFADRLFTTANAHNSVHNNGRDKTQPVFTVVRYGNLLGSSGSVVPRFLELRGSGALPLTGEGMTRFHITAQAGADFVFQTLAKSSGGEIFIPKMQSFRVEDLAEAIAPGCRREFVGLRPGEKIHEDMITETDAPYTVEYPDYYVILPFTEAIQQYAARTGGKMVAPDFRYSSGTNPHFLTVDELRGLIRQHIDPNFTTKY